MKIILLGAGQVGGNLAENLASEENDITVVDTDGKRLRDLQDRLDIRTVNGLASLPDVLKQAGAEDADMLIAVTNSDEVNMIACQVAFTLYRTPMKIARIRNPQYIREGDRLFKQEHVPIDVLISPELLVTNYIQRLIETPGALQVLDFAQGQLQLVAVKAVHGGLLVGQELRFLKHHMPSIETRVAAIFRKGRAITPQGSTVIEADDEIFFIAGKADINAVMSELRRKESNYKRIMIAGGGNIGYSLAKTLESRYSVKIIERNEERADWLSNHLTQAIVLNSDASDQDLMLDENIEDIDIFLSLTDDDEVNIMASMLAKRLGARKVMTLINNTAYVDLVQGGDIDIAISPSQTTIGSLLTHVRRGDIVNVYSLRRGAAEAIEAVAHGDERSSKVVGRSIEDIDLPEGCTIGAIVRKDQVIIAHDHTVIESGDHVILFLIDKRRTVDVERLFQVGFTFF
ncbi:Trk system potassium transporter TrkA [Reinekea marina]|uniref:Trk system potassium uptake protein TrkA n=1 Tax=Reinekea marina TaxID=1310421 RepID=A0ABV7WNP3_9GAMM|nr:Trk system potassium transporter TrkA [Reinekea marina]MDN3647742.1 Trk system potassium transporter TrkA [Reinekea marina]